LSLLDFSAARHVMAKTFDARAKYTPSSAAACAVSRTSASAADRRSAKISR